MCKANGGGRAKRGGQSGREVLMKSWNGEESEFAWKVTVDSWKGGWVVAGRQMWFGYVGEEIGGGGDEYDRKVLVKRSAEGGI
jgi:hypothetical protein